MADVGRVGEYEEILVKNRCSLLVDKRTRSQEGWGEAQGRISILGVSTRVPAQQLVRVNDVYRRCENHLIYDKAYLKGYAEQRRLGLRTLGGLSSG